MQHGLDWEPDVDPTGWLASEKFNGCRAYWDGRTLWSRGGIAIGMPAAWRSALPTGVALDGELYAGPQGLNRTVGAVRYGRFTPEMTYRVFDAPAAPGPWPERMRQAAEILPRNPLALPVDYHPVAGLEEAFAALEIVLARGGEGLILRHPDLPYRPGRTPGIRKLTEWTRQQYRREDGRDATSAVLLMCCTSYHHERNDHARPQCRIT